MSYRLVKFIIIIIIIITIITICNCPVLLSLRVNEFNWIYFGIVRISINDR
jgi:hypothetical protein